VALKHAVNATQTSGRRGEIVAIFGNTFGVRRCMHLCSSSFRPLSLLSLLLGCGR
jgi:hypothetical protein